MKEMLLRRRNGEEGVFRYDVADAELIEAHRWYLNGGHKGRVRYAAAVIGGKMVTAHRLLMGFPAGPVDHIDGNGLNNCRANLRETTHAENIKAAYALHGNWAGAFKHGISFHSKTLASGRQVLYAYDRASKKRLSDREVFERLGAEEQCGRSVHNSVENQ